MHGAEYGTAQRDAGPPETMQPPSLATGSAIASP